MVVLSLRTSAVVLLSIVLVGPAFASVANSASSLPGVLCPSGEPATGVAACSIEEGSHEGELLAGANEEDVYRLDPSSDSIIRVEGEASAPVEFRLEDPSGQIRGVGGNTFTETVELSVAAKPSGQWLLHVQRAGGMAGAAIVDYAFDLTYEAHDNFLKIDGEPGMGTAVVTSLPNSTLSHVELRFELASQTPSEKYSAIQVWRSNVFGTGVGLSQASGVEPTGEPHVWAKGEAIPEDVSVSVPQFQTGTGAGFLILEVENRSLDLAYGLAYSGGITNVTGWVVWDGPEEASVSTPPTVATFRPLAEFEPGEEGQGFQLGAYAYAENLETTYDAPRDHTTLIGVNGFTPQGAVEGAQFAVTAPDGNATEVRQGSAAIWWPPYFPADKASQPGTWDITAEHVDGLESNNIRLAAASFPFTLEDGEE